MLRRRLARYLIVITFSFASMTATAKEVTLLQRNLTLNAELELAEGKTISDGVVLIMHDALAHRDMELMVYLRALFRERGYSTLAINLGLGLDDRHGMYDCNTMHRHSNDDAVNEIGLWVDWLRREGARDVILLGHSRGGAQTALYAAERHDDVVKAVILMAPTTSDNNSPAAYLLRYGQALEPLLAKSRELVSSGMDDALLGHVGLLTCAGTTVTAGTFLSYYGQDPRLDTPYLLPRIKVPTLVVVAGADSIVIGLDRKVASLVDGQRLRMTVVEGADHMFLDIYADQAIDVIDHFLQGMQKSQGLLYSLFNLKFL